LLDVGGNPVSAPNTYKFGQRKLEVSTDANGQAVVTQRGTKCCDLVAESLLAGSPTQVGARYAAQPIVDETVGEISADADAA
jgi:hypothetical protein